MDRAAPGDTIRVAPTPGTPAGYTEGVDVNKANLKLLGPHEGIPANERSAAPDPADEAVVDAPDADVNISNDANAFLVTAAGVTISGFAVVNTDGDTPDVVGIALRPGSAGAVTEDNIVRDQSIGVSLQDDDARITDNAFVENDEAGSAGGTAIYADTGVNDVLISDNLFDGNPNSGAAILGGAINGAVRLADNEAVPGNGPLFNINGLGPGSDITNNVSRGSTGSGMLLGGLNSVPVRGNVIDDAAFSALRFADPGVFGYDQNTDVEVVGNQLTNSGDDGIRATGTEFTNPLEAHINRISGNGGEGVQNGGAGQPDINAQNNFWGCNTGPNTAGCDTTLETSPVNTDPYLQLRALSAANRVQVPGSTPIFGSFRKNNAGGTPADIDEFPSTPVAFSKVSGPGDLPTPFTRNTANGVARSAIGSNTAGLATYRTKTDNAAPTDTVLFTSPAAQAPKPKPPAPPAPNPNEGKTITGTPGNDVLVGTPGPDRIICGDGNDRVIAGAGDDFIDCDGGNDTINAGAGNDRVLGGTGNDFIRGTTGNDRIRGQGGNDSIGGGGGNDRVLSGSGDDAVAGNEGDDRVDAGGGDDNVSGNEGNDLLKGSGGRDRISGNDGNDRIRGGFGNDRLRGNDGNDRIGGGPGKDKITGASGDDTLFGNSGNDRLFGGTGNDRLFGGTGNDFLDGGSGTDVIVGGPGRDTRP